MGTHVASLIARYSPCVEYQVVERARRQGGRDTLFLTSLCIHYTVLPCSFDWAGVASGVSGNVSETDYPSPLSTAQLPSLYSNGEQCTATSACSKSPARHHVQLTKQ